MSKAPQTPAFTFVGQAQPSKPRPSAKAARSIAAPPSPPPPVFGRAILSTSLTAALLNVAVSILDAPLAFESLQAVLLPLALTLGVFLVVSLLLFLVFGGLRSSLGLTAGPLAFAVGTVVSLAALLWPLFSVLRRDMEAVREPVLWAVFSLLLISLPVCAYLLGERLHTRFERGGANTLLVGAPLLGLEVLLFLWLMTFGPTGTSSIVRLGVLALAVVGIAATVFLLSRFGRALRSAPILWVLLLLIGAGPTASLLPSARGAVGSAADAPEDGPPRVILLTIDTLRSDYIAKATGDAARTPAIDSLAQDSVFFTDARSAAPWTKPALASILTGVAPEVHRTSSLGVRLPEELDTLAEHMKRAGYATAGMGINVHLEHVFNFSQGFDEYRFPAKGEYGTSFGALILEAWDPSDYPSRFANTEAITNVAMDWVRRHADERFFLWIHLLDPHWPFEPPAEYIVSRRAGRVGDDWGFFETVTNVQAGNVKLSEDEQKRVKELYRGEIEYTDDNIGRFLDLLKELELYDDSLIVLAADHGEEFWEHGTFEHGHTMYDEVMRVPLLFKLPNAAGAQRIDLPVSTEGLTPTVLDLVGISVDPENFSSPSLRPYFLLEEREAPVLYASGTHYYGDKLMVVFDDWKYVQSLDHTKKELLFNLREDPQELKSLTSSEPAIIRRARTLAEEYLERSHDLRKKLQLKNDAANADASTLDKLRDLGYFDSDG